MVEYIERKEIFRLLHKLYYKNPPCEHSYQKGYNRGLDCASNEIANITVADVAHVRHGKWIKYGDDSWECSECHSENCYAYDNNLKRFTDLYCPNCGAKMDGKAGEQE